MGDVDVDIGGNPSAEDEAEALESSSKKVVDLQDAFRLQEGPSYSKKELMTYLKARAIATCTAHWILMQPDSSESVALELIGDRAFSARRTQYAAKGSNTP